MRGLREFSRCVRGRVTLAAAILVLSLGLLVTGAGAASTATEWAQLGGDIDGAAPGDQSGGAVSLSADGSQVAIGATLHGENASHVGQVRVFDQAGSSWVQVGGDIDGEAAEDFSGNAVSLSADGTRLAIGAARNSGSGLQAGQVRVFDLVGSSWVQVGADIDGEAAEDLSGTTVSLSADGASVAIGATHNDGSGSNAGHVRVFGLVGGLWVQVGGDIDGEASGDESGTAVSLSADGIRVAIGSVRNTGSAHSAGHVRVFDLVDSAWSQLGDDIDGEKGGDRSGGAVSLSADGYRVAIGATANDGAGSSAGHVRVFDWIDPSWVQVGGDIDGAAADEQSGNEVSLSADGMRVAVSTRGLSGPRADAGRVRVFDLVAGEWVRAGSDLDGEASMDRAGESIALSADGSSVAIGAGFNDGAGVDAGHVRVFKAAEVAFCAGKAVTIDMNMGTSGVGASGDDVILGTPGDDVIDGGDGDDTVCAGDGDDLVIGGPGDDVLFGEAGGDIMRGNTGADLITGGLGDDRLLGGVDGDTMTGGPGNDYLGGFGGDDMISGGGGNDTIFGGFGADTIDGDAGSDVIRGLIGNDIISGGNGNDTLYGDRGNDLINGNGGNDTVNGGNANDILSGDDGDDVVSGGKADDALSGGLGTDICAGNKAVVGDTTDGSCETIFSVP